MLLHIVCTVIICSIITHDDLSLKRLSCPWEKKKTKNTPKKEKIGKKPWNIDIFLKILLCLHRMAWKRP